MIDGARPSAALGVEVVGDHEDRLAAEAELAASGLRLSVHAGLSGSIRPGDGVRAGSPWDFTIAAPVVERSTPASWTSVPSVVAAIVSPPNCDQSTGAIVA